MESSAPIRFLDPNYRIEGKEIRSKLLDPDSYLYKWIDRKRNTLIYKYPGKVGLKRMDYHIELLRPSESEDLLVERAGQLDGQSIILMDKLDTIGRALVLEGPFIEGYGRTHITVAYFPGEIPDSYYDESDDDMILYAVLLAVSISSFIFIIYRLMC